MLSLLPLEAKQICFIDGSNHVCARLPRLIKAVQSTPRASLILLDDINLYRNFRFIILKGSTSNHFSNSLQSTLQST